MSELWDSSRVIDESFIKVHLYPCPIVDVWKVYLYLLVEAPDIEALEEEW
jgi:hypothetical protein